MYNFAHKHYLTATNDGELKCHSAQKGEDTIFFIERDASDHFAIRASHSRYLVAEPDGKFHARGERQYSKWTVENTRDGGVALKGHNVAWYLGASIFGNTEALDNESYDRAHWRVEVQLQ